jgi:hypothetical protein
MGRWGDAFRAYSNIRVTVDTADISGSVQVPDGASVNTVSSVTLAGDTEAALPGEVSALSAVSAVSGSGAMSSTRASPAQAAAEECNSPSRDTADTADTIVFVPAAAGRDASESANVVTDPGNVNAGPPPPDQVSAVSAVSRVGGAKPRGQRLTVPTNDRAPAASAEGRAVLEVNALVALAHATARQDADGIARVRAWFQRFNETAWRGAAARAEYGCARRTW